MASLIEARLLRGKILSASRSGDRERGADKQMTVLWDVSEHPEDNSDRGKKLGSGDATHAMAFCDFVKSERTAKSVDGITSPAKITARRMFEPDNWMLRLHSQKGREKDGVWALRLIADDNKPDKGRLNRSTMVIDECDKQNWAFVRDLLKIRKLDARIDDNELRIDDAGFLSMLCESGEVTSTTGGVAPRACLMLNISKRGGHVSDGVAAAQLWHVFSMFNIAGSTGAKKCGDVFRGMLGLRGDVEFNFLGRPAHIALGEGKETDGEVYGGFMFLAPPGPIPPDAELDSEDAVSNQTILPRQTHFSIRPFVKIPQHVTVPPSTVEVPSGIPDRPGTTVIPTTSSIGSVGVDDYSTSLVTGTGYVFPLPDTPMTATPERGINIVVNFVTPNVVGGIGTNPFEVQLDWVAIGVGAAVNPTTLTGTANATLDNVTYPGQAVDHRVLFFIPSSNLVGKEGGKLSVAFYRRGDREIAGRGANPNSLSVAGVAMYAGSRLTGPI